MKKLTLMACAVATAGTAMAASSTLGEYFDSVAAIIPNKLKISAYERISYEDNIFNSHSNRKSSVIFKTGADVDWYRENGNWTYGLEGDIAYEAYCRESSRASNWAWDISPVIKYDDVKDNGLRINLQSTAKREKLSNNNTSYARHYKYLAGLAYEYKRNDHWGIAVTGDYEYNQYPQKEFSGFSKHEFEASVAPYWKNDSGKFKAGLRAAYTKTHFEHKTRNNDNYKLALNAFADYRMTRQFSVYGEIGSEKAYYRGESRDLTGDRSAILNYKLALRYKANKDLLLELISKRNIDNSTASRGAQYVWDNAFVATWKATDHFSIRQKIGFDYEDEKNNNADDREFIYDIRGNYVMDNGLNFYAGYKYNYVKFRYLRKSDYSNNELYLGVRYTFDCLK